jgi:asparagine synthase (glutamine-hydrolysing)
MIRAIAGVVDRSGRVGEIVRDRLAAAVRAEARGDVAILSDERLTVAFEGPEPARRAGSFLLIDGFVDVVDGADVQRGDDEERTLTALESRGEAALDGLRGDFALLHWDGRAGLLARDQLGGRTWVWHDNGTRLAFATEIALLLRVLETTPPPDPVTMAHWLGRSGQPGDRTIYEGIRRIEPACAMRIEPDTRVGTFRYWNPRPQAPLSIDASEAAARLRDALTTAVARRTAGSDETSVLLSGGLDSSTVAGVAARALSPEMRPQRSYSAVFPRHPTVDESELIALLNRELGLRGTQVQVRSGSVANGALEYLERWALPASSPNLFFWFPLLRSAGADGTRVMLDGEGGDETYGLSPYLIADRLMRGRYAGARRLVGQIPGAAGQPSTAMVRSYVKRFGVAGIPPASAHALSRRLRRAERYAPPWFSREMARTLKASVDGAAWKRLGGPRWWGWLTAAASRNMGSALLHDHSRRRAAIAGIVPRHPLVDVDVIELVLRFPPELAFDPHLTRPLLREAGRDLVPDPVRLRPSKSTFDAVFHEGIAGPDRPLVRAMVGARDARVREYVNVERLSEMILDKEPPSDLRGRQGWALDAWRLLTAEFWLRYQEDPAAPRRDAERIGLADSDLDIARS